MKPLITTATNRLKTVSGLISKHSIICFFVVFASLAGYLVMKAGNLSQAEPTQFQVDEKLSETKELKVDSGALKTIRNLKDRETTVAPSFDTARTNPFED